MYIFYKAKDQGLSKFILMIYFGMLIFLLLNSYSFIHDITILQRITFLPTQGAKLALAPLLLLYIQSLFLDDKKVLRYGMIYLTPFVLFVLFVSLPYLIAKVSQEYFISYKDFIKRYLPIQRIIFDIVFLLFLLKIFKTFYKFKRILKCNYSNIEHNNFIWVRYLLIAPTVIIFIDLLFITYQLSFGFLPWSTQNITMLLTVLFIIYAVYYGVNQSKVLIPYFLLENDPVITTNKEVVSEQQESEFSTQKNTLMGYIEKEKPYLDEELTLNKLASGIGTTDKKLSILLNQYIKISFYNFINSYRINEFKKLISSPLYVDYTIEGIAYECGFKSKASFYRLFKKETGQSPSEYKNNLK